MARKPIAEPARNPGSAVLEAADAYNAANGVPTHQAADLGEEQLAKTHTIHFLRGHPGETMLLDGVALTRDQLVAMTMVCTTLDHPALCMACAHERHRLQADTLRVRASEQSRGMNNPPSPVFQAVLVPR